MKHILRAQFPPKEKGFTALYNLHTHNIFLTKYSEGGKKSIAPMMSMKYVYNDESNAEEKNEKKTTIILLTNEHWQ